MLSHLGKASLRELSVLDRVKLLLLLGTTLAAPTAVMAAEAAVETTMATEAAGAAADAGNDAAQASGPVRDDAHPEVSDEIIVTAPFQRDRFGLLTNVSVLDGTELTRELRGTIGETLTAQAGVSASYFGPNASRPILRGFQGERVRVLTDGIGSFDVSNTSADHAVVINPLLAERIEVLHGPTSLLYGSSAIGGVVNVIDTRIPRHLNDEPVHVEGIVGYGSAASDFNGSGTADIRLGSNLVLHFDGSYLNAGDTRIGGFVLSEPLREAAIANGADDVAALKGRIPNTSAETWTFGAGLAWIGETGNIGLAISQYDSNYGVPIRWSLEPGVESEAVRLDVQQTRLDARAEFELGDGFLQFLRFRYGFADYQHSEIAEDGAIGTTFFNNSMEGRLELVQADRNGWKGAFGVQFVTRDFDAVGDEAFVPRNFSTQIGAFLLQEATFGSVKGEFAFRIENSSVAASTIGINRSFTPVSVSGGASVPLFNEDWRIGIDIAYAERAPSPEELLSDGPHVATQAYEVGNPDFRIESSIGGELVLRGKGSGFSFEASAFYNNFNNFIYEQQTGEVIDDLPVFQYLQADAVYWGFEIQGNAKVADFGDWSLNASALADYVNAEIDTVGPAPRIPPFRIRGGLDLGKDDLTFHAEAEYGAEQTRVADFETTTPAYTLVNASITWTPWVDKPGIYFVLSANNLLNENIRRAASFLKDYAPTPGRDFRATLRFAF
jgi:iron complex outermembrane receptor protein